LERFDLALRFVGQGVDFFGTFSPRKNDFDVGSFQFPCFSHHQRGKISMNTFLFLGGVAALTVLPTSPLMGSGASDQDVVINRDFVRNWKVLSEGAPIHGSNGLAVDSQNRLYIASVLGSEVVVMDPKTGAILDRIGMDAGVITPDDVTIGGPGSAYEDYLFWTSIFTGEVGRLSPDGVKITAGQVFPGVNPITLSDDDRLFVAHDFFGFSGLYEIDPAGLAPPIQLDPNFYNLNGFDFGPDGLLYGPIAFEKLLRLDVNSAPVWSEDILNPADATAVKFDSRGRLHTLIGDDVVRVDPETGVTEVVAHLARGLDNLVFDSSDKLYVSSSVDGTIFRILCNGLAKIISRGGMVNPGGIAVLPCAHGGDSVIVGDLWSFRQFNGRTGHAGPTVEVFGSAATVAPYGDDLVTSGSFDNSVFVIDGETLEPLGPPDFFALPLNAIQFGDDIAVAELMTGSVVRGDHSPIASGLAVPTGLAASDGNLYVADWALGMVFQIAHDGTPIAPIPVATGLSFPEGMAVNTDGSLLVVEGGLGRLSRLDLETGELTMMAEGLQLGALPPPGGPPIWTFNGVAVGSQGHIYVTGDKANVIYRFKQRL
jgi:sugar lactone lactonase YvrE